MKYAVTLTFTADRELNEQEKEMLMGSLELQIQEPWDINGEDEEYCTLLQDITIEGEAE